MRGNCYYQIDITGKKSELKDGVNTIYVYLIKLAKDKNLKITKDEISEIKKILEEIDASDASDNMSVKFFLGHPYEFLGEDIGYEESLFPAAKLMPTAEMSVYSEWEGPGDCHTFSLILKKGKISIKTTDWDADWGKTLKSKIDYILKDGDWIYKPSKTGK